MAVPKRKTSKRRKNLRRGQIKATLFQVQSCPSCGANQQSHRVCTACGVYKGRQVLTVEV
ncbi:MAG: 50S ribosomal protein L32 [Kiritimatiellia bacterium]|jgi:large subunit ribosomal protein L32